MNDVDYWEEVILEDGSVWFYNHTSQEYSPFLPVSSEETETDERSPPRTDGQESQTDEAPGSTDPGTLEGQVWGGDDGEIFVPWPDQTAQGMNSSPEATDRKEAAKEQSDEQPETREGETLHRHRVRLVTGHSSPVDRSEGMYTVLCGTVHRQAAVTPVVCLGVFIPFTQGVRRFGN